MLPGQSDKNKKTFYKIKKRNSRDGQLFLLIYYLACFIQKLLQTGCYIKYGKIHLLQSAHHEYPAQ